MIFEQWWEAIQPALQSNTLNFWQTIYKEIYLNVIKDGRWLNYLQGLGKTLEVSFFAILVGLFLGTILAILRLPQIKDMDMRGKGVLKQFGAAVVRCLSRLAGGYINLMRGTPLLLQVLLINFGVFGSIRIEKIIIGVIACGLNSAAYVAEIVRGGIMSVEKGQTEAGRSLGLSGFRTMMYIVLPQAAKSALPAMCNEFISLIKETSVVGYIAVLDLTKISDLVRSRTYEAFFALILTAVVYFVIQGIMVRIVRIIQKKIDPRRRSDKKILEGIDTKDWDLF